MTDPFSRIIASFSMYKFISALTTPFNQMAAYKTGVIDAKGLQIVPDNELSQVQQNSFTDFDRLVISLKRIIVMVPDPWVRSYMKSPVTAVKLMSEECEKLGGDPEYFTWLAARELLACQYINEEAAAAIANSVGGGGVSGLDPETLGIPVSAQKRHVNKNKIFKRKKPLSEESTEQKTEREFGKSNTGLSGRGWGAFLGKGLLRATKHYITREGENIRFGSKGSPPSPTPTPSTRTTTTTTPLVPPIAAPSGLPPTPPPPSAGTGITVSRPRSRRVRVIQPQALPQPVSTTKPATRILTGPSVITRPDRMLPDLKREPVFTFVPPKKKIKDTVKINRQFKLKKKYSMGTPVSGVNWNIFTSSVETPPKARKKKKNSGQMTFDW